MKITKVGLPRLLKWIFVIGILLSSSYSNAQLEKYIPTTTAPSPDAAALGKYGQFPVNLSSGLVDIDIPLFTIQTKQLAVPLSLSYHPSDIKVDDVSSWAGLGWVLNGGGVITRFVKGIPDIHFGKYNVIFDEEDIEGFGPIDTFSQLYDAANYGGYDSESDIYYYNVNGLTGSFRFDIDGELIQLPLTNNKIEFDYEANRFIITSSKGIKYIFSDREQSLQDVYDGTNNSYPYAPWFTSSWYLSRIESSDGSESISYSYLTDTNEYQEGKEQIVIRNCASDGGLWNGNNCGGTYPTWDYSIFYASTRTKETKILQSITFPGGSLDFLTFGDRLDRRKYRLAQVNIKDHLKNEIKNIKFYHSYFTPYGVVSGENITRDNNYNLHFDYRLKLDKVTIQNYESYSFGYNINRLLPRYVDKTQWGLSQNVKPGYGQDNWGYYNGVSTNKNLLTNVPTGFNLLSVAGRSVNSSFAQACVLNSITYPTGGFTEFEYEGNVDSFGEKIGGLRIEAIKSYSGSARPLVKTYDYAGATTNYYSTSEIAGQTYTKGIDWSFGFCGGENLPPSVDPATVCEQARYHYYLSDPAVSLAISGANVFYSRVTEFEGTPSSNIGKTEYAFEMGGRDSEYNAPNNSVPPGWKQRYEYHRIDRSWKRGQLKHKKIYNIENGTYNLVRSITNKYDTFWESEPVVGFYAFENEYFPYGATIPHDDKEEVEAMFQFSDIIVETGWKFLTETLDTTYTENGKVSETTNYAYSRNTFGQYQVSSTSKVLSDGSTYKTIYKYPGDLYSFSEPNIYNRMVDKNIVSEVIEKSEFLGDNPIKFTRTNYKLWDHNIIAPYLIEEQKGNAEIKPIFRINSYDNVRNILSAWEESNVHYSFLWGYNKQYPIATVMNASQNQIAYTSFENSLEKGGWTYSHNSSSQRKTGRYSFQGTSVIKSNLPSGYYTVGFWAKKSGIYDGLITINGSSIYILNSEWEYREYDTPVPVTNVSLGLSNVVLDELRLHPKNAEMTTQTFEPLVGVSSKTAPDGSLSTYVYDNIGRLELIKDQEENILSQYNYRQSRPTPTIPSGVLATSDNLTGKYTVSWNDDSDDELFFRIVRSVDGSPFETLKTMNNLTDNRRLFYTDPDVKNIGQRVLYGVSAEKDYGIYPFSYSLEYLVPTVSKPSNVTASFSPTSGKYTIHWLDNSDNETNFKIEVNTNNSGFTTLTNSLGANSNNYLDNNVYSQGSTVQYKITASNGTGESIGALSIIYTVGGNVLYEPSEVYAIYDPSVSNFRVHWIDNSNNELAFEAEASINGGEFKRLGSYPANTTSIIEGYTPNRDGLTVQYRVRSTNTSETSNWAYSMSYYVPGPVKIPSHVIAEFDITANKMQVFWDDNSDNESSFEMQVSVEGGSYITIDEEIRPNTRSRHDSFRAQGTSVKYRVRSISNGWFSGWAESPSYIVQETLPAAPAGVIAFWDALNYKVTIQWLGPSDNEENFRIQALYSNNHEAGWQDFILLPANSVSYERQESTSTPDGIEITLRIRAENSTGNSAWVESNTLITGPEPFPAPPTSVVATWDAINHRSKLLWVDASTNEEQFRIQAFYDTNPGAGWQEVAVRPANTTAHDKQESTGIPNGINITLRVRAESANGNSPWVESNTITTY